MCGIAGLIARDHDLAERALGAMLCAEVHRGPDDEGREIIEPGGGGGGGAGPVVALGQRRLSIIDLSPLGHQPMRHAESGDVLTYNGELYNYMTFRRELEREGVVFRGHSDTEVMLAALVRRGPRVIERFEGMFALAWWRAKERTLVLARDPAGIKPLYVARTPRAFAFASEVRALAASGLVERSLDRAGLATLLAYGAVQAPFTLFRGVREFPAGSIQELAIDAALGGEPPAPRAYWAPPRADGSITEAAAKERLRATLEDAVRDHLVSDVPVGVFLSSGIDSTLLAGLAAKHLPDLRSFTVAFADNPDLSEGAMAAETARRFGLRHAEVQITAKEAEAEAARWLVAQDQPSMDGLNVYIVSGAVKRQGMTVALSGLGGDEVFGGYPSFIDVPRLAGMMRKVRAVPRLVRPALAAVAGVGRSVAYRQKLADMARSSGSLVDLYLQRRRAMSSPQLAQLGLEAASLGLTDQFMDPSAVAAAPADEGDPVWTVSMLEARFYMGNMLLRDADINGMAHSQEIRVPMLDKRILDGFMAVPGRVRLPRAVNNKHLLREAFPDLLRPELLDQPKRGFTLPLRRWMLTSLRETCEDSLRALRALGVLRPEGIDSIWNGFLRDPESPIWSRALTLAVLGAYVKRMGLRV